ncbi:cytidylyltransferase domain-containing protein [Nitrosopumilus ureiphilus]|uniref:Acylneuraminate cytidylyltransferase n=1 Tax=Nitrosopumilus ureiphilus TaxID=1470067 RepID=A0A7D5R5A4_9ARCH|nr:NTP transferase domain-containing protein [Nitrosopumilus ureiphilus]QLH05798.1 acylneuraminate cytidylyltransferase [Nitrosopumilus ureiphilus]
MNVDIFIPVRLNSTRLRKKHLEKIGEISIIEHLVNRLKNVKNFRKIIVCTTNNKSDDELVDFLEMKKITYFRGDEKNILKRFVDAAREFDTDIIIDVEGDKLFTEPDLVNKIILEMKSNEYDFIIGSSSSTFDANDHFIHGIIPTGIRVSCIKKIASLVKSEKFETGYKEFFESNSTIKKKIFNLDITKLKIPKNLRLTIDYPEDLEFAKQLFRKLDKNYTYLDILELLDKNGELLKIIKNIDKKWAENYKKEISENY